MAPRSSQSDFLLSSIKNSPDTPNVVYRCRQKIDNLKLSNGGGTGSNSTCSTKETVASSIDSAHAAIPDYSLSSLSSLLFSCCHSEEEDDSFVVGAEDRKHYLAGDDFQRKEVPPIVTTESVITQQKIKASDASEVLAQPPKKESKQEIRKTSREGIPNQIISSSVADATIVFMAVDGRKTASSFLAQVSFPEGDCVSILPFNLTPKPGPLDRQELNVHHNSIGPFQLIVRIVSTFRRMCSRRAVPINQKAQATKQKRILALPDEQTKKDTSVGKQDVCRIITDPIEVVKAVPLTTLASIPINSVLLSAIESGDRQSLLSLNLIPCQENSPYLSIMLRCKIDVLHEFERRGIQSLQGSHEKKTGGKRRSRKQQRKIEVDKSNNFIEIFEIENAKPAITETETVVGPLSTTTEIDEFHEYSKSQEVYVEHEEEDQPAMKSVIAVGMGAGAVSLFTQRQGNQFSKNVSRSKSVRTTDSDFFNSFLWGSSYHSNVPNERSLASESFHGIMGGSTYSQSGERQRKAFQFLNKFYRPMGHAAQTVLIEEWDKREEMEREEFLQDVMNRQDDEMENSQYDLSQNDLD